MKILVTGVSGFAGSHVARSLVAAGHEVVGTSRSFLEGWDNASLIMADSGTDLSPFLDGVELVIHAAGVAHNPTKDPVALRRLFDDGNRDWTHRIAAAVADSGVKAMIHLSSIAAAGKPEVRAGTGFTEDDETNPEGDYGRSKREAEPAVIALQERGKLGINLRPPLIYGPGTKGNWAKLIALSKSGLPLPFAGVANRRSYLGIDNLCDLLKVMTTRLDDPELSGTYHVADREWVSLPEVVTALRSGIGRKPGLIPFPVSAMQFALEKLGRGKMAEGLFEDLILDVSRLRKSFAWNPPEATLEGMRRSIQSGSSMS